MDLEALVNATMDEMRSWVSQARESRDDRGEMLIQEVVFYRMICSYSICFYLLLGGCTRLSIKDIFKIYNRTCINHSHLVGLKEYSNWICLVNFHVHPGDRLCKEQLQGGDFQGGGRIQRFMRNLHEFDASLSS